MKGVTVRVFFLMLVLNIVFISSPLQFITHSDAATITDYPELDGKDNLIRPLHKPKASGRKTKVPHIKAHKTHFVRDVRHPGIFRSIDQLKKHSRLKVRIIYGTRMKRFVAKVTVAQDLKTPEAVVTNIKITTLKVHVTRTPPARHRFQRYTGFKNQYRGQRYTGFRDVYFGPQYLEGSY